MNSRKLFSLILRVFSVAVVVSLPAFSTNHPWGDAYITGSPGQPQIADGGGPAPPYPPPPSFGMLVADGGGPAPPYPKPPVATFGSLLAV